jgi:hypothetical protein
LYTSKILSSCLYDCICGGKNLRKTPAVLSGPMNYFPFGARENKGMEAEKRGIIKFRFST